MRDEKIRRKLAAIFAADVAGYSRLMADNEEDTTRRLSEHRAIMDALISHHGGRIANTAGDSVLAEFDSSVEAVRCAVEVQEALRSKNDGFSENRWLQFRIGINVGDVILQGDDLLGDGINVAARLEAMAEPGGICISGQVRDQIEGKLTLRCVSLGEKRLKNIRRPVQAFKVASKDEKISAVTAFLVPNFATSRRPWSVILLVMILIAGGAWLASNRWRVTQLDPAAATAILPRAQPDQRDIDEQAISSIATREILKRGTFGGHEYALVGTWGVKWIEAEAEARAMGGYLSAIGSEEENRFITDMIRDEETIWRIKDEGDRWQKFGPWIGLVQLENAKEPDGGWVWSNGEPMTYVNWFWHQPDNYNGRENFGRYRIFSDQPGVKWDDAERNSTAKGYVVEFETGEK